MARRGSAGAGKSTRSRPSRPSRRPSRGSRRPQELRRPSAGRRAMERVRSSAGAGRGRPPARGKSRGSAGRGARTGAPPPRMPTITPRRELGRPLSKPMPWEELGRPAMGAPTPRPGGRMPPIRGARPAGVTPTLKARPGMLAGGEGKLTGKPLQAIRERPKWLEKYDLTEQAPVKKSQRGEEFLDYAKERYGADWERRQEAMAKAGKGDYRDIDWVTSIIGTTIPGAAYNIASKTMETGSVTTGFEEGFLKPIGDIFHNIGQWDLDIDVTGRKNLKAGEVLTALGHGAAALYTWAFVEPPIIAKPVIGDTYYSITGLRDDLGVDMDNPQDRDAWISSLQVSYSGKEAVGRAYREAKELSDLGVLTPENKQLLKDTNETWWKEIIGEMIFDPTIVFGVVGKGGKSLKVAAWAPEVTQRIAKPLKIGKRLATTQKVLDDIALLGTKGQQIKEATGFLGKFGEIFNLYGPRFAKSMAHRNAKTVAQLPSIAYSSVESAARRELGLLAKQTGKAIDTTEFAAEVSVEAGKRFQEAMFMWSKLASNDLDEVERAAAALKGLMGDLPASQTGRRTAIVIKELIGDDGKDMLNVLDLAKKEGRTAEHVANALYTKASDVLEKLIPVQKWETNLGQRAARNLPIMGLESGVRQSITKFYSELFMGWSIGYAQRNFFDNSAKMFLNGVTPFSRSAKKILDKTGVAIYGAKIGIGQAGDKTITGPGARLAQAFERQASESLAQSYYKAALDSLWPKALKKITDVPKPIRPWLKHAVKYGTDALDELVKKPEKLTDAWRALDDDIVDLLDATEPHLTERITEIVVKSDTLEDALADIRIMQQEAIEHLAKQSADIKPMGPAMGTLAGQAVENALDSGRFTKIEELGKVLGDLEHTMQMSRNKAVTAILDSVEPDKYAAVLRQTEEQWLLEMRRIAQRQAVGYAQLLAGRLKEDDYVKYMHKLYSKSHTKLDDMYNRMASKLGKVASDPNNPEHAKGLLRMAVARSAYAAQYPSISPRGLEEYPELIRNLGGVPLPDKHFTNKIKAILRETGRYSKEELDQIKNIRDLDVDEMAEVVNYFTKGRHSDPDEIVQWMSSKVDQKMIDDFGALEDYHMRAVPKDADPEVLLETLREQHFDLDDRLDMLKDRLKSVRASAKSGVMGDYIPELEGIQGRIDDLTLRWTQTNEALDDMVELVTLKQLETIAQATGDLKTLSVVEGVRAMDSLPAQTPTMLDSLHYGNARVVETLDAVVDSLMDMSKLTVEGGGVLDEALVAAIKGKWTETQAVATEMARMGRDYAILDYTDRRYMDTLLQVVFPWHYWWSRSIPNWATGIIQRPDVVARYMRAKDHLRNFTENDPNIPEWAKDHIPIRVPGYEGSIYVNMDAMFNATATMFETFDDEDRTQNTFGQMLQTMGQFGPAPHPALMAAYAASRGVVGDTAGMRSYGYLSGHTRTFAALSGKTLEPWLWLRDPETGDLVPFKGGTKWDIEKGAKKLTYDMATGKVGMEAGMVGAYNRSDDTYMAALDQIVGRDPNAKSVLDRMLGYRGVTAVLSNLFGVRATVQKDWELELAQKTSEYSILRDTGQDEQALAYLDANPWLSASWMAYDNDQVRMEMLAKNVLHRIPPLPGEQKDALLQKAGLSQQMMDLWYASVKEGAEKRAQGIYDRRSPLEDWDRRDYETFSNAILNMAEILAIPNAEMAGEWRTARNQWTELHSALDKEFPMGKQLEQEYFTIRDTQGQEIANEFARINPTLDAYWTKKNWLIKDKDMLFKYYKDAADVDSLATSLGWDAVEEKYGPEIFDLRRQLQEFDTETDPDAWWKKREFKRIHPEIEESYDYQDQVMGEYSRGLDALREITTTDIGGPETISYIIDDKPNAAQMLLLEFIEEMQYEAAQPPAPPEEEPEKWSPASIMLFDENQRQYNQMVENHPNFPQIYAEYKRIEREYGKESAQLFAQRSNMYRMQDELTLAKLDHPLTLIKMTKTDISFAAKAMVRQETEKLWPGLLDQVENVYYKIPRSDKRKRRAWRDAHPNYYAMLNWKDGAVSFYENKIKSEQTRLIGIGPEIIAARLKGEDIEITEQPDVTVDQVVQALGDLESGGGGYTAESKTSTASGKYQYTDATWNLYGGYARAMDAPPEVQDRRMKEDLQARHKRYNGDIEKIIAAHYYPKWADDKSLWDQRPTPDQPTIRRYVDMVLERLKQQ